MSFPVVASLLALIVFMNLVQRRMFCFVYCYLVLAAVTDAPNVTAIRNGLVDTDTTSQTMQDILAANWDLEPYGTPVYRVDAMVVSMNDTEPILPANMTWTTFAQSNTTTALTKLNMTLHKRYGMCVRLVNAAGLVTQACTDGLDIGTAGREEAVDGHDLAQLQRGHVQGQQRLQQHRGARAVADVRRGEHPRGRHPVAADAEGLHHRYEDLSTGVV